MSKKTFIGEIHFGPLMEHVNTISNLFEEDKIDCILFLTRDKTNWKLFKLLLMDFLWKYPIRYVLVSKKKNFFRRVKNFITLLFGRNSFLFVSLDIDVLRADILVKNIISTRKCYVLSDDTCSVGLEEWCRERKELKEAKLTAQH